MKFECFSGYSGCNYSHQVSITSVIQGCFVVATFLYKEDLKVSQEIIILNSADIMMSGDVALESKTDARNEISKVHVQFN